jgi:hypothetical protein
MNPANGVQPTICPFDDDQTLRWSTRSGDYILWVGADSLFTSNLESSWRIQDFWQMQDGDFVTITSRWPDLPAWFEVHPLDVAGRWNFEMYKRLAAGYKPKEQMIGPNIWRVKAGERLVWVAASDRMQPVREILDLRACALAIAENVEPSGDVLALFRCPKGEKLPPDVESAMRAGFKAAVGVGVPRDFSEQWWLGG